MLACLKLLFINKAMMTETEFEGPTGAPMAKVVSILLIIGQVIMVVSFVLFLLIALILGTENSFGASLLETAPRELDASTLFAQCLAGSVVAVGWFFVLRLLRRVVNAVVHGDPFLPENVSYLRNIWIIIAATEIFRTIAFFMVGSTEDGSRLDINIATWFFIFIIVAISEAFRQGAALRADQELTI